MANQRASLDTKLTRFIEAQKMFFVATAASEGRVNISPKGMDTLRVLDPNRIAWLNLTGSGNETAAHVLASGRMTLMFCAFEGKPLILRIYGTAVIVHPSDAKWADLGRLFPGLPGARQIFELSIESVLTSCGTGVPLYQFDRDRNELIDWADRRGQDGIEAYWRAKNRTSLDGLSTGIKELET